MSPDKFWLPLAATALATSSAAQVPSLDSMAGKWLSGPEIVFPPTVTSTWGAAGCTSNLTGFRYCNYPPIAQGGDAAVLLVDGKPLDARDFRWFPYQALRKAIAPNGLEFTSATRMRADGRGVLIRLTVKNPTDRALSAKLELRNDAGFRICPGVWPWQTPVVDPADGFTHTRKPGVDEIADSKSACIVRITRLPDLPVTLAPSKSSTFDILCSFEPQKRPFAKDFALAKAAWDKRWRDCFTPGNQTYSGNLPTLVAKNRKLKRVYYLGVVTMLAMERTALPRSRRCFVTVGPHWGNSLEYFWDTALFSTCYALLDPKSMRDNLTAWLTVDIHNHYAIDYLSGQGVGPWYAPNDYSVFTSFWKYGTASGDSAWMRANADRFIAWAEYWKKLVRPGQELGDFGDNDNLLECTPAYVNMVPSLNAAHVGLMRQAALLASPQKAAALRAEADKLAKAVLELYVPGDGVWKTRHRDGTEVANRHVYDYVTVGTSMPGDLTPTMKREMTAFVDRELLADGWIRALSLSDPYAAVSDRPDHGPKGSYPGWPAMAALTMSGFGQYRDAENMLELCEKATWQGPFPQGFELLQVPGTNRWIPRIAFRGCDYNESCGAAFVEAVVMGLFGVSFDPSGKVQLEHASSPRPVEAELLNLKTKRGLRSVRCGRDGVTIAKPRD